MIVGPIGMIKVEAVPAAPAGDGIPAVNIATDDNKIAPHDGTPMRDFWRYCHKRRKLSQE